MSNNNNTNNGDMDVEPPNPPPNAENENEADDVATNLPDQEDEDPVFIEDDEGEEVIVDDTAPVMSDDEDDSLPLPPNANMDGDEDEGDDIIDTSYSTLTTHRGPIYALALIPNPTTPPGALSYYIASGSGDDTAQLTTFEVNSNGAPGTSVYQTLPGHAESVATVEFSTDKSYLATADYSGTISLWTKNTTPSPESPSPFKLDRTLPAGPTDVEWLSWHPKGNVFAVGSTDGTVWMYLAKTGAVMQVFAGHDPASDEEGGGVSCGEFTADGTRLLTTGGSEGDSTLRIWNPKTGIGKHVFRHDTKAGVIFPQGGLNNMARGGGQDNELVAVGSCLGEIGVVHMGTKKVLGRPLVHANIEEVADGQASVEVVKFSKTNPNFLASGGVDGRVCIWEIGAAGSGNNGQTGALRATLVHPGGVTALDWHDSASSSNNMHSLFHGIYTSCADGAIRLWDVRSHACVVELKGHGDMILCFEVAKTEGGDVVVSGSDDHTIRVWTVSNEQMISGR